ncbi:YfcE family phosphodiesterase [Pseudobacteroides cellulosolvens]|uniref:Phosphoesterase n=1 Tax=Pseudobacteroides cellulosolvens ATCC 35603 = DSM 2933 TaxID=398512 RepID=A0A0L6JVB5_9FIRM|nr:metallophosphoesterase [Pseudobacteroides cellulosolvens]KNY29758.1 phosphodiesterase, MJ0936 family [Pseudobacteroides cellulosolvens ATCC 35603 = DSM 2933]
MKILLFSDSHGYTLNMVKAAKKYDDIDMIIHLGDFLKDILKLGEEVKKPVYEFVAGNNDWAKDYPTEKLIVVEGKKIFITHGHLYNVKNDYKRIISKGISLKADAVFFGHTHKTEEFYYENMMVLNPGSISVPVESDRPTYCIIEIKEGRIVSKFASPVSY